MTKKRPPKYSDEDKRLHYLQRTGLISSAFPDKVKNLSRGQKSYFTKLIRNDTIARVLKENQSYVAYKCQSKEFISSLADSGYSRYLVKDTLFIHCGVDDRVYVDENKDEIKVREQTGKKTKRVLTYKLNTRHDFVFDEAEGYMQENPLRRLGFGESVGRNLPSENQFNRWGIYNAGYTYEELLEEINKYTAKENEDTEWCLVFRQDNYPSNRKEEIIAEKEARKKSLRMKKNMFARIHKSKD